MDCAATRTPEEREFLRLKSFDMAFGYIQMARRRPRPEEIANMALADWGQGNIFNGVVDQLGLIWEDVDGKIIYRKNPSESWKKSKPLTAIDAPRRSHLSNSIQIFWICRLMHC